MRWKMNKNLLQECKIIIENRINEIPEGEIKRYKDNCFI